MQGRRGLHWTLVALSGVTLILVGVNLMLGQNIRSIQADINQRQQYINQSIRLGRVNEALIRTLAQTAVNEKDDRLREVLGQSGITISIAAKPAAAEPPPTGTARAPAAAPAPAATPSSAGR
jgi:hypothetical protein